MKITVYQDSRVGGRANNQDRLLYRYTQEALLMVVADGMGGHSYGEIAAQIATVKITERFEREARPHINDPAQFLIDAFIDAHVAVKALSLRQPRPPLTTCVACIVQDGQAWWAHAGDSRLYVIRDEKLLIRTRDHSYVEGLFQRGIINEEDTLKHPHRNVVLSCLGTQDDPRVDREHCALHTGDLLMLCSDGVWESMGESTLIQCMGSGDIARAAPLLLDLAANNAGDGADNLTLIAIRWEGMDDGPVTIVKFPDTVFDISHGTSPRLISNDEIERAIADIRSRISPN